MYKFDFQNLTNHYRVSQKKLASSLKSIFRYLKIKNASVNFRFVNDQRMIAYNRKYFGKSKTTDVISFPWEASKRPKLRSGHLGDVIINLDRAKYGHRAYGNTLNEEVMTYVLHGILHLFGYEDTTSAKKKKMFHKQDILLEYLQAKKMTKGIVRELNR